MTARWLQNHYHGGDFLHLILHRIKSTCIFVGVENVSVLICKHTTIPVKSATFYFTVCIVEVFCEVMFLHKSLATNSTTKVNTWVHNHMMIQALFQFTSKATGPCWAWVRFFIRVNIEMPFQVTLIRKLSSANITFKLQLILLVADHMLSMSTCCIILFLPKYLTLEFLLWVGC